jgi:peptidoglycan/xylan/chitin deacetylase (PgdA/CDA1 family)/GT2 family glycosyltransferase
MTKLSVIIPTFNRRRVLQRTLPALAAQDLPPEDYEVIIVMDGSTDGTAELLRGWKPRCAFRALEAPHRGPGAARNLGIRNAVGELVLFLDDDLIAGPDLLRRHCASHSGSEFQVVHGPIYVAADSSRTIVRHVVELRYERYYRNLNPSMKLRFPDGMPASLAVLSSLVNSSMPRDVLLRCKGFDEEIWAAEDLELGLQLWKMGTLFSYCPAAAAFEYYVKSSLEYLKNQAQALGSGDLLASRAHSEYRPYSSMAGLAVAGSGKKWLRAASVRVPISPVPLLALPLRLEKLFYKFASLRNAAVHLLSSLERITRLRSAVRACGSWKDLEKEFDRKLPVLLYHHVGPFKAGTYRELTVLPKKFERQIRWLARRGYVGIKPADWLEWVRSGKSLPEKPILLTFDDAYADIAEYALPILRKYGFRGAVFVVTERLGATNTWDEAQGCGTLHLMTAEQIRYWTDQGIEFGAHSRTHAHLTELSSSELSAEVSGSKADLTALLGHPPVSFAYPYGDLDDSVRDSVRGEFDLAFSTQEGLNYLSADPHLLKRSFVGPGDSLFEFALIVRRGGIRTIRDWRIKLALRTRLKKLLGINRSHP